MKKLALLVTWIVCWFAGAARAEEPTMKIFNIPYTTTSIALRPASLVSISRGYRSGIGEKGRLRKIEG